MALDLTTLDVSFRELAGFLLDDCRTAGHPMRPFFTVRHPSHQAKLWRQSRTREEVEAEIAALRGRGAPYLSGVLDGVGPQFGPWVTNAVPGNSWHQHARALDCFALVDGRAAWDDPREPPDVRDRARASFEYYAKRAEELGLRSLASIGDRVHVQSPAESSPARTMTWPEIDVAMRRVFGR